MTRHKKLMLCLVICLLAVPLAGCSGSGETTFREGKATEALRVSVPGETVQCMRDEQGRLQDDVLVGPADGSVALSIPTGTSLLDDDGSPLSALEIVSTEAPSEPVGARLVSEVYSCAPAGAQISPYASLTVTYRAEDVAGVEASQVYPAAFRNGGWERLDYKEVEPASNRLTMHIRGGGMVAVLMPDRSGPQEEMDRSKDEPDGPARVKLVYFHRKNRCHSCIYAEEGARYVVNEYFGDELAEGRLTFEVCNVDDNPELAEKYQAFSSSLYVNTIDEDGTEHIEQVEDIWVHIGDDQAFVKAVRQPVEAALYGES